MTNLKEHQECPYCGDVVDDSQADWDEGTHDVECDHCGKEYVVTPIYDFKGFKAEKFCKNCIEVESDCYCDDPDL